MALDTLQAISSLSQALPCKQSPLYLMLPARHPVIIMLVIIHPSSLPTHYAGTCFHAHINWEVVEQQVPAQKVEIKDKMSFFLFSCFLSYI